MVLLTMFFGTSFYCVTKERPGKKYRYQLTKKYKSLNIRLVA